MKYLSVTATAIALALVGCGAPIGLHPVGQPMVNDDGHSWTRFISAGDCADPQCWSQATGTGVEYTHYVRENNQWVWHTEAPQLRPVTSPAAGLAFAQMAIPAAGTVGAGALIRGGEIGAAEINAYGNYAAAGVQASGAVKAAQATKAAQISNVNGNYNVNGAYATGGAASATGGSVTNNNTNTQQQQQQQFQHQHQGFSAPIPPMVE